PPVGGACGAGGGRAVGPARRALGGAGRRPPRGSGRLRTLDDGGPGPDGRGVRRRRPSFPPGRGILRISLAPAGAGPNVRTEPHRPGGPGCRRPLLRLRRPRGGRAEAAPCGGGPPPPFVALRTG